MAANSNTCNKNAVEEESHDLMHCCICMEEYDSDVHKPKFISCHHTFCLQCLKKMIADQLASVASVTCPVCKTVCPVVGRVAEQLPTNMYALNIVQLIKTSTATSEIICWCLVCRGTPTKNCLGHHLVINLEKDAEQLESLLVVKSTQVSKYFKEAVVKREKIQEHLQHNLEAIKIQMAENRSHLQALQIKMAKEARINRLVPTQQASSFSSIVNDLKKVLQEAKDEIKAADKMLNQVSVINVPTSDLMIQRNGNSVSHQQMEAAADETIDFFGSRSSNISNHSELSTSIGRLESIPCRDLINHGSIIRALEFSDDGSLLVSGGAGDLVHLWNVDQILNNRSGKSIPSAVLKVTSEFIGSPPFSMAISPDNNRIVVAGSYPYIFSYDAHTAMQVNAVPHHSNTVFSISLQPGRNGQVVAAACDSILRILDTRSGSTGRSVIDMTSSCSTAILWSVMFSPTHSNLVAASGSQDGARLYDIRSPNSYLYRFPNSTATKSVRFNRNGTRLLCSKVGKSLVRYDVPAMTSIRNIIGVDCFNAPGYEIGRDLVIKSPCCFAGTDDELVVGASDDNNIYVWSSADSLPLRVFRGHHDTINSVRYNSRNSILASCGIEGVVKLWSI